MGWLRELDVVALASTARFQAGASTLENSVAPPLSGVLAQAWRALFVAWKGMLGSPGFPLLELWQTLALGCLNDCPGVVVAAANSLGPVDPS